MLNRNRLLSAVASLCLATGACGLARAADNSAPATQPSAAAATENQPASTTPKKLVGRWVYGSVSPLTYWDSNTGQFLGNAHGAGELFELKPDGTYKEYVYLESRMYNMVTQVWTIHEGTIAFAGDTYTIRPTKGHYRTDGTRKIDRDMTPDELAKQVKTYNWRLEQRDGKPLLVVPFQDGSKFEFRPADETPAKPATGSTEAGAASDPAATTTASPDAPATAAPKHKKKKK